MPEDRHIRYLNNDNGYRLISGSRYKNIHFGLYSNKNPNNFQAKLFVQGSNLTRDMPVQGKINYHGDAILITDDLLTGSQKFNDMGYVTKDVTNLEVDFKDKTVKGSLSSLYSPASDVDIDARITGNKFSGSSKDGYTEGAFFGRSAEELAGKVTLKQGRGYAVFGAQKEKSGYGL